MTRILIGAFEINGVNLTSQGLWAHPAQQTYRYTDIGYWLELAGLLDAGGFDFLFFADSYGYPDLAGRTPDVAFEQGAEIPKNDPMLLIPALAAATTQLNFAVTASTTYEAPFANARRFGTLDHITRGRIAWNVVTTTSTVVRELFGRERLIPHDERYAMAQEHLAVSYELFEGSWADDAVVADKAARLYARPDRVRKVVHHGAYFDVEGYFNCEPSAQRTPVIFQAGGSPAGMAFAARNAEVVFLQSSDADSLRRQVEQIRRLASEAGRDPSDITAVVGLSAVVGDSVDHARERLEDYLSYVDSAAAGVYFAQMTGIDLTALDPETPISSLSTEQSRAQLARYDGATVGEAFADFARHGMREHILLGTGEDIARQMVELVESTGIDGFNFTPFVSPGSYREFIEHVIPALRRRGAIPDAPTPATFRERLRGTPAVAMAPTRAPRRIHPNGLL